LEADAFRAVNDLPDVLRWPLWPIMQLGTLWMLGAGAAVAYALTGRRQPALAAAGAVLGAWVAARAVKEWVGRGRPADLLDDVHVRGPGHSTPGYVSGHTAVAFAVATVIAPLLPPRWRGVPFALAALVALARIFFGAHLPLDVLGGAGVGIICGLAATVASGGLRRRRRPPAAR
jgi:undecaprenyl-diphosphatase